MKVEKSIDLYTQLNKRVDVIEGRVTVLENNTVKDIIAAAERAATAAASAEMLRLAHEAQRAKDALEAEDITLPRDPNGDPS